jgi:hypothetical protein
MATDPLSTLRKTAALWESAADAERRKGDGADLKIICEAMSRASAITAEVVSLEHKLGVKVYAPTEPVGVFFVGASKCCPQCGCDLDAAQAKQPRMTFDELRADAKKRAAPQLLLPGPKVLNGSTSAPEPVAIDVTPPPRRPTESVHGDDDNPNSCVTERTRNGRGTGSIVW